MVNLEIKMSDAPGSLHQVVGIFAALKVNVIEVSHQRTFAGVALGETVLDATLETRGNDHLEELLKRLATEGYQYRRRFL